MGLVNQAGYYAVIPADVLYDPALTPNAKLLYAVISNFCNFYGYCTCKNSTFAKFFSRGDKEMSERTVERILQLLRDTGHIKTETENVNGKVKRRIWLSCAEQPDKNDGSQPDKNDGLYKNNNKNIKIPPIAPQGAVRDAQKKVRKKPTGEVTLTPEMEERFTRFWAAYPVHRDKQRARYRWQQLSPDDDLVVSILDSIERLKLTDAWQRDIIPLPSTFLNNRRWEDAEDLAPAAQQGGIEQW